MMQILLVLGHHHQRLTNSTEIIRLQHEDIAAKGKEVQSLNRRVTEVEDLLARRDADVEKKDAELESRTGELERVRTLNGQLEGRPEDASVEIRDLRGQISTLLRKNEETVAAAEKDKEAERNTTRISFLTDFIMSGSLTSPWTSVS